MVTGCDSGLGFETAKRLDEMGFHVIAACLFPERDGAKKLAQVTSSNLRILGLDVTSDESCVSAVAEVENIVKDKATGLHALINNAGVAVYADFDWQKMEHCEMVINVNLLGSIRVTKHFLKVITRKTGRIINITSILAYNNTIGLSIYGAAKAGLESFSNTLRIELYDKGIQVCTIAPGLMTGATGLMSNSVKSIEDMWAAMSETQKQENQKKYEQLMVNARKSTKESSAANQIFEWSISNILDLKAIDEMWAALSEIQKQESQKKYEELLKYAKTIFQGIVSCQSNIGLDCFKHHRLRIFSISTYSVCSMSVQYESHFISD
ncbi:D-beta-hydroxybutyrate dehydrogenase, mitochondrial [Nymphon striatum]|nr:D-beta-hydroxybutyrate dehydrogenase, mitochondrial [Nymphon striatum]